MINVGGELMIGIFWVWQGNVLKVSDDISNGVTRVPDIVDSNLEHNQQWVEVRKKIASLADYEYFDIARGRVLFNQKLNKHLVYINPKLNNHNHREIIANAFWFASNSVIWRSDIHYVTDDTIINDLFA